MTRLAALVAVLSAAAACEPEPRRHDSDEIERALTTPSELGPWCGQGPAPAGRPGVVELALFVSTEVAPEAARELLRSGPGYYAAYGAQLRLVGPVRAIRARALLGPGSIDEALAPLARFMHEHAVPALARINIVVLPTIASTDSPARRYFTRLEGLTLTPEGCMDSDKLFERLELPERFTPTILLSAEAKSQRRPGSLDLALAHELGHALGLKHASGQDLMSTASLHCVPELQPDQLAVLRAALARREGASD